MANPNQIWGQTRIVVDGVVLNTEGKSSIEVGGTKRTAVEGDFRAGMWTGSTAGSKIECTVLMTPGVSLVALQAVEDATLIHRCDTGQTYIVRHAFVVDAISASEGKAKVVFNGPPAEEEL